MGETYRLGLGAIWQVKPAVKVGVAYEYSFSPDLSLNQFRGPLAVRVSGQYSNPLTHFLAFNLSWQF